MFYLAICQLILFLLCVQNAYAAPKSLLEQGIEADKVNLEQLTARLRELESLIEDADSSAKEKFKKREEDLERLLDISEQFKNKITEIRNSKKSRIPFAGKISVKEVAKFLEPGFKESSVPAAVLEKVLELRLLYESAYAIVQTHISDQSSLDSKEYNYDFGYWPVLADLMNTHGRNDYVYRYFKIDQSADSDGFQLKELERLKEEKESVESELEQVRQRQEDPVQSAFERYLGAEYTAVITLKGKIDSLQKQQEHLLTKKRVSEEFPRKITVLKDLAIQISVLQGQLYTEDEGWTTLERAEEQSVGEFRHSAESFGELRESVENYRSSFKELAEKMKELGAGILPHELRMNDPNRRLVLGSRIIKLHLLKDPASKWEEIVSSLSGFRRPEFLASDKAKLQQVQGELEQLKPEFEEKRNALITKSDAGGLGDCRLLDLTSG